jgi:hypothetical protein
MAFGDPQILETRYAANVITGDNFQSLLVNGPLDLPLAAGEAPGWTTGSIAGGTKSTPLGTRTGGNGTRYFRWTMTASGTGFLFDFYQDVDLRGNRALDAFGHSGRAFTFKIWARNVGTGTMRIALVAGFVNEIGGGSEAAQSTAFTALTGTWTQYTLTVTPSASRTARINLDVQIDATVSGNPDIQFDEAEFYRAYTFEVNPTIPDDPDYMVPGQTFVRTVNNSLMDFGPLDSACAKLRYQMNFGMCGLNQLQELRSLWLLGSGMRWTPNLPHLPSVVEVRIVGKSFPFAMHRTSTSRNQYHGSLMLEEI